MKTKKKGRRKDANSLVGDDCVFVKRSCVFVSETPAPNKDLNMAEGACVVEFGACVVVFGCVVVVGITVVGETDVGSGSGAGEGGLNGFEVVCCKETEK